ncbi:general substrate transporter [Basidiobolus meristosporus CBS 931.73]|uniref:General substrate transporter n=1 Tax=Basidiobolus meristosporus CBS 931.73 TaxID=1314790 RepID=A0A1Y1Y0M6_9FUNG|nr:general substrate transporter [Basidiobolus meristosporus CBS 931.73]|eukprot:ORX91528.1 general substrate transporter [Basidiobolus meristosporus CBS 931.73]
MKDQAVIQTYALSPSDKEKSQVDIEVIVSDSTKSKISLYVAFNVLTAVLASYVTGFNVGSPNIPQQVIIGCNLEEYTFAVLPACLPMTPIFWGFTLATFALGALVAGLSAGSIADRFGRRKAIWMNNILIIIAGIIMSTSGSIPQLIIGRFFAGLAGGSASTFVPMFISEIAPLRYKGRMGTMTQVAFVSGVLTAQGLALRFTYVPGWRILLSLTAIPSVFQIVALCFCTETPAWLIRQGRIDEARTALQRLRKGYNVDNELDLLCQSNCSTQIEDSQAQNDNVNHKAAAMRFTDVLREKNIRRGLLSALALHAFQQLCGINAVIYYSTSIFRSTFGPESSGIFTVIVAATNVLMTLFSTILVDRLGRKPLLLCSSLGMCISCILAVIAASNEIDIMIVASVIMFVAFYATGLGPLPWLLVPEFLPPAALGIAASMCCVVNWFFTFLVGFSFPAIKLHIQQWSFLPFSIFSGCCALFVFFYIPETKFKLPSKATPV